MPSKSSRKSAAKKAPEFGPRWPLAVAKARLSEIMRLAHEQGPQIITVHGQDVAEVSARRVTAEPVRTLRDFFEASKPYRAREGDEDIEFDTSFPITDRPIDLP